MGLREMQLYDSDRIKLNSEPHAGFLRVGCGSPGEVAVAVDVVTVVELQHLRPVGEEQEVGEARPVQPHLQWW